MINDQETETRPEATGDQSPPVCDVFSPTGTSISLTQALEAEEVVTEVHYPNNEKRELPHDLQEATPPELAAESSSRASAVGCRANPIDLSVTADDFFNLVTGAGTLFNDLKTNWLVPAANLMI